MKALEKIPSTNYEVAGLSAKELLVNLLILEREMDGLRWWNRRSAASYRLSSVVRYHINAASGHIECGLPSYDLVHLAFHVGRIEYKYLRIYGNH